MILIIPHKKQYLLYQRQGNAQYLSRLEALALPDISLILPWIGQKFVAWLQAVETE